MKYSIVLHNKPLQVEISQRAEKALEKRDQPLIADIHLIFGCMIAKRVWFKDGLVGDAVTVCNKLRLAFHTVKYKVCSFENIDNGGVAEPFTPDKGMDKFMPHYIFIDFQKQKFTGEFTFNRKLQSAEAI
jgi:hypothetical protein